MLKHHCDNCDKIIIDPTTAYVIRRGVVAWADSEVVLCRIGCVKDWMEE